jgi:hypothetical protein
MDPQREFTCIMLPASEWQALKKIVEEISQKLNDPRIVPQPQANNSPYITAKEFMAAVRICRSNFDKLVHKGKIMTLKKGRKVYVVASEVERYFREVAV